MRLLDTGQQTSHGIVTVKRLILSILAIVALTHAAGERVWAQVGFQVDAGASSSTLMDHGVADGVGLATGLRYDHPRFTLSASGLFNDDGGNEAHLGVVYRRPLAGPLRLTLEAGASESALWPEVSTRALTGAAAVSLQLGSAGVYLRGGYDRMFAADVRSPSLDPVQIPTEVDGAVPNRRLIDPRFGSGRLEAGGWQRVGPFVLRAALSASRFSTEEWDINLTFPNDSLPPVYDSVLTLRTRTYGDGLLGLSYAHGPAQLNASIGSRLGNSLDQGGVWGRVSGTVRVHPLLALVASAARLPDEPGLGLPARQYLFAGVRLGVSPFRDESPAVVQPGASTFIVRNLSPNNYVLLVRAVDASAVELQGDFTDWESVRLTRNEADLWEAPFQLESGPHRVVIRVDGGSWSPPPGLRTVPDDFYGHVGLIVVP